MSSVAVGIDLGVNGAIAVISDDAVTVQPLPLLDDRTLDALGLDNGVLGDLMFGTASKGRPHLVVFESVFRPNSLVQLGGEAAATCKLLGLDFLEVPVVRWKKEVLGVNSSDKQIVIDWCRRTYPQVNLKRTPRARTDSHDFADAVALAHYAKGLLDAGHDN